MTLKMFEEGDNLYIEIAGDPSLKKKIKEGLSSLVGKELVQEINGLLPKEDKPKIPDRLDNSIRLLTPKEEPQGENNQQDKDWDDWGEPVEQEAPKAAETKPETEVTSIADDDDDW